jgi:UDP-glucose 4-epimerase
MNPKSHIMVTGGAGYIGSHMLLALNANNLMPVVFDNLSRGHKDSIIDTTLFQGDLRSISDLRSFFSTFNICVVMHFAGLTYVEESVKNPDLYYENNVIGTLNLIKIMKEFNVNKIVFSSSCAVYGEPLELKIREDHRTLPISPYGKNKLEIESYLKNQSKEGLQSISLRYFNAAGSDTQGRIGERHDPETHLIPLVLEEALRLLKGGNSADTKLKIFGNDFSTKDGTAIRDYIHVEDLCDAHMLAIRRLLTNELIAAEFYNLANENGFSVVDVINAARIVTGQPITYQILSRRKGDPAILVGDASKAKKHLKWSPKHKKLDGIIESAWRFMLKKEQVN